MKYGIFHGIRYECLRKALKTFMFFQLNTIEWE